MTVNVGTIDKIIRLALGAAMIAFALGYLAPGTSWSWIGWIGAVPIATALVGRCGIYSLLGYSTCSVKR
jgi:sulfite exporter TauE/SafE